MSRAVWILLVASLSVFMFGACGDEGEHEHDEEHGDHSHDEVGPPSGAECPDGSTLTYENFGKEFIADYCLGCHSSKVTGNARMGAPGDHNFDTLGEIDLVSGHIDQLAAFGPDSENDDMPRGSGDKPTDDERRKLGEWIACGLEE